MRLSVAFVITALSLAIFYFSLQSTDPIDYLDSKVYEGIRHRFGIDTHENPRKALALFEEAAKFDHPEALYQAASMLKDGEAGFFDRKKAFDYTQKAAAMGHVESIYSLGCYYMNGGMGNLGYSREVLDQIKIEVDEEKGLELYHTAAKHNHKNAVFRLARYHYYNKKQSDENLDVALQWYDKGVELNEASCMVDLGDLHVLGMDVERDHEKAKELYQRALKSEDNLSAKNAAKYRLKNFSSLEQELKDYY